MQILKGIPNILFTADQHYWHRFLVERGIRPFPTVEEMNEALIAGHNEVVRKGDLVYCLGDMFVKASLEEARKTRARLAGNVYLIEGNHDKVTLKLAKEKAFVWVRQLERIKVGKPWFEENQAIVLCHYAMRTWRNSHHGSWHLYGHSHGQLPEDPASLSFDVFGATLDLDVLKRYRDAGVTRAIWMLPSKGREEVLPLLDKDAELMRAL